MASTNFTTHFEIPLPLGSDLTTPMDYNESMEAVDTALFQAQTDSTQAASLAGQAIETANTAASAAGDVAADLTLEKAKIVALQTRMTNAENEIDDVRSDVQDSICAYNEPTATSTHHYNVGDYFFYNDTLYITTAEINISDTIIPNTNCDTTTITAELLSGGSGVDKVGNLADLTTTNKSNCVAAINEVNNEKADKSNTYGCIDNNSVYHSVAQSVAYNSSYTTPADGLYSIVCGKSSGNDGGVWYLDANRTMVLLSANSEGGSMLVPLKANTNIYTRNVSTTTYSVVGYFEI